MSEFMVHDNVVCDSLHDSIISAVLWSTYCTVSDDLDALMGWNDDEIWSIGSLYAPWRREISAVVAAVRG